MATKSNKINLTADQKKMAEMLANPDITGTKSEFCEEVGVNRVTLWKWLKKKEFTDYVSELIDKYTDAELGTVWKALINKCSSGDVAAIKLYFEVKGKYKQQIDISGGVVFMGGEDKLAD